MAEPRTLVVTGASRGLGAHVAGQAHAAGYRVIGLARRWGDGDRPYEMQTCDVTDPEQVEAVFKPLKRDSSFYGLVNAAGIASMNLVLSTPAATMQRVVATNLLGTMYASAGAGRVLARRKRGRIVNFSTIAVQLGLKGEAVYVASKSGVEGFTRAFAREMADFGVTVNALAPGPIDTDLIRGVDRTQIDRVVAQQVIPEMATPETVWDLVSYLLDDRSAAISGQVINVQGA
jgi:3-oxoacyl-[acyl-carrier protein] reductase